MRVLIFSDIHLDAVTAGRHRYEEVQLFLDELLNHASTKHAELVMFAGDAHDRGSSLDAFYSSVLTRFFFAAARLRTEPAVVAIAGNHDVYDTSVLFRSQPITTLTPVRAAVTDALPAELSTRVHILDRPHTRAIGSDWAVLALPYVSRVHSEQHPLWEAHAIQVAQKYRDEGRQLIVVGHRVIPGAKMGSESVEMAKGQDMLFPVDAVEKLTPALVINGHYHKRQTCKVGKLEVEIPGSPIRFTFGDAADVVKGSLLVEL